MATRFGTPGGLNFSYWVETPSEQFVCYARTMLEAVQLFLHHCPDYEPMLVRQMSDNE